MKLGMIFMVEMMEDIHHPPLPVKDAPIPEHLLKKGVPAETDGRIALPIAGNDAAVADRSMCPVRVANLCMFVISVPGHQGSRQIFSPAKCSTENCKLC